MGQAIVDLNDRPIHTPIVTSFEKSKQTDGSIKVGSAILKRYYSVIDAEIYFGNQYVDDVSDIAWTIQQKVQPLYGFNSYTLDEYARGNRIVTGSFRINFTSPNYLFKLLEAAKGQSISNIQQYSVEKPNLKADDIEAKTDASLHGAIQGSGSAPIWPQTFDIDVVLGEKSLAGGSVHVMLTNVTLISCQMILSAAGGSPNVGEVYSFMAQDIKTIG